MHLALSDYEKPQREHYELLELCRRGDEEAALALLARHVRETGDLLLESIKE